MRVYWLSMVLAGVMGVAAYGQGMPGMPAGHPPMGGTSGAGMAMPPGHPAMGAAATMPVDQPAVDGALKLKVAVGTKDGAPLGAAKATVAMYHEQVLQGKYDVILDAHGEGVVKFPVTVDCQPLITLTYDGLAQEAVGPVFTRETPVQPFEMKVFEVAKTAPALSVTMRHVLVQGGDTGVEVMEMLIVNNPTDRIWTGVGNEGERTSFVLRVPEGANVVSVGGNFSGGETTKLENGYLAETTPMYPGAAQYQFTYTLPVKGGKTSFKAVSPIPVDQMVVSVGASLGDSKVIGLEDMGVAQMNNGAMAHKFKGARIAAGQTVTVNISGIAMGEPAPAQAVATNGNIVKHVAVVGGIALMVVGLGAFFMLRPKSKAAA